MSSKSEQGWDDSGSHFGNNNAETLVERRQQDSATWITEKSAMQVDPRDEATDNAYDLIHEQVIDEFNILKSRRKTKRDTTCLQNLTIENHVSKEISLPKLEFQLAPPSSHRIRSSLSLRKYHPYRSKNRHISAESSKDLTKNSKLTATVLGLCDLQSAISLKQNWFDKISRIYYSITNPYLSKMSKPHSGKVLRLISYLHPNVPVEVHQVYQQYLEEVLGITAFMMVESRWSGPSIDGRNPFIENNVDIAFACGSSLSEYKDVKSSNMELLPVAPVHITPGSELQPVYFSKVIISADKPEETYKEFKDLKGHKFAYNDEQSMTGSIVVLKHIRRMGSDATFFGDILHSGSHLKSIEMVLDNRVDCAAVDSNCLYYYSQSHPEYYKNLRVLLSIGPLPGQPILVRADLDSQLKNDVKDALLRMHEDEKWSAKLKEINVWGFKEVTMSDYEKEVALKDSVKEKKLNILGQAYY